MAEVFGIVAGTLSFASIVMQLLDTVKKVSETWDLIKGASAEHQALSRRIKDVEALLQLLANKELDGPLKPIMESMLVKCGKQLGALQDQLVDLQEEPTTKRARMKKSLKIVFTAKRVEKMEGNLQALLGNLSMVVQAAQCHKIEEAILLSTATYKNTTEIEGVCRDSRSVSCRAEAIDPLAMVIASTIKTTLREELRYQHDSKSSAHEFRDLEVPDGKRSSFESLKRARQKPYHKFYSNPERRTRESNSNVVVYQQWKFWMVLGTLSLQRQSHCFQDTLKDTVSFAWHRFGVSFSPSLPFIAGLTCYLVRDAMAPQFQISLTYRVFVPETAIGDIIVRGGLRHEIEAGKLPVNAYNEYGETLLHMATRCAPAEVKYLVERGADVYALSDSGKNVLSHAIPYKPYSGDRVVQSLQYLMNEHDLVPHADINNALHRLASFYFPLSWQVRNSPDWSPVLSFLGSLKLDVNSVSYKGRTPLQEMLVHSRCWDHVRLQWFLSQGADVNFPVMGLQFRPLETGLTCLHYVLAALQPALSGANRDECFASNDHSETLDLPPAGLRYDYIQSEVRFFNGRNHSNQLAQRLTLKALIQSGADIHASAKFWGTPTDMAKYTNNEMLWQEVLSQTGRDVLFELEQDASMPRQPEVIQHQKFLDSVDKNRKFLRGAFEDFRVSLEGWPTRSATQEPCYSSRRPGLSPLKRDNCSSTENVFRLFLLDVLFTERISRNISKHSVLTWLDEVYTVVGLFRQLRQNLLSYDEVCFLSSCVGRETTTFHPNHPKAFENHKFGWTTDSYPNIDEVYLEAAAEGFIDFIQVCQAKARGVWTTQQEEARKADESRLPLVEDRMYRLFKIIVKVCLSLEWTDEIMGWDREENQYEIGDLPGQWREYDPIF